MKSFSRPTWMPLAVLALCTFGTLAAAQARRPGMPAGPPGGFGPPVGAIPAGPPSYTPPGGANPGAPPGGFGPPAGANPGGPGYSPPPAGPPGFGPMGGDTAPMGPPGGSYPGMPNAGMPNAGMPNAGMPNAGMPNAGIPNFPNEVLQNQGNCSKCNKTVTWTGNNPPNSCPHCKTRFDFVENVDGTKTYTTSGKVGRYIGIGVAVIMVIVGIISAIVKASSGGGTKKKKLKKRKPMRRPRDDDDY